MKVKCIIVTNKNSWVSESIIRKLHESNNIHLSSVLFFNAAGNLKLLKRRFKQYGLIKIISKLKIIIQNKICSVLKIGKKSKFSSATSYQTVLNSGIKYKISSNLNSVETIDYINQTKPNIVFVMSCSQILSKIFLGNENITYINFHDSLLPAHKGPSPSFWVLYNQEKISGYTLHTIAPKVDSGKILYRDTVEVLGIKSEEELIRKVVASLEKKVEDLLIKINQNVHIDYQEIQLNDSYEGIPNYSKRKELKRLLKNTDYLT
ncbi:MAG: formyltransferase family protein [Candidatus Woykebacteria bacterium]